MSSRNTPVAHPATLLLLAAFLPAAPAAAAARQVDEIDGDPVYQVLEPGAIPAIVDPDFVRDSAAEAQMRADEPVLGVVIDGDARAYSLWQLDAHEIVNDRIGGRAIAVTW
jgi:hypothetical protein